MLSRFCSLSPLEFELAIYNLLKNAKEALEAQNVKNPEITLAVNEDKDSCRIAIADNGSKVSDDELQRIQVSMSSRKKCRVRNWSFHREIHHSESRRKIFNQTN